MPVVSMTAMACPARSPVAAKEVGEEVGVGVYVAEDVGDSVGLLDTEEPEDVVRV